MCEVLEKDLYAVLGACPTDTAQQLKHKYQELALQVNIAQSIQHEVSQAVHKQNFIKNVPLSVLLFCSTKSRNLTYPKQRLFFVRENFRQV